MYNIPMDTEDVNKDINILYNLSNRRIKHEYLRKQIVKIEKQTAHLKKQYHEKLYHETTIHLYNVIRVISYIHLTAN